MNTYTNWMYDYRTIVPISVAYTRSIFGVTFVLFGKAERKQLNRTNIKVIILDCKHTVTVNCFVFQSAMYQNLTHSFSFNDAHNHESMLSILLHVYWNGKCQGAFSVDLIGRLSVRMNFKSLVSPLVAMT